MSFTHVLNNLKPDFDLPFKLDSRHSFARATDGEIQSIKLRLPAAFGLLPSNHAYEFGPILEESGHPTSAHLLPSEHWRYYVVRFDGSNELIGEWSKALVLAEPSIELGMTFLEMEKAKGIASNPSLTPFSSIKLREV